MPANILQMGIIGEAGSQAESPEPGLPLPGSLRVLMVNPSGASDSSLRIRGTPLTAASPGDSRRLPTMVRRTVLEAGRAVRMQPDNFLSP